MNAELKRYIQYLEAQPWYGDLLTVLVTGVCHVPNEYYPHIMEALERLGKFSRAMRGRTDAYTYVYSEPARESAGDDDCEYPVTPAEPDVPKGRGGMAVAEEILRQMGGKEFIAMTGSKNLMADGNTLRMCLAKNKSGANRLFITYRHHPDIYTMRFFYYRAPFFHRIAELGKIAEIPEIQWEVESFGDIYCDMLRPVFERVTGFDARMPKILLNSGAFEYGSLHFTPLRGFREGETDRQAPNDSRPWKRDMQYALRNMKTDAELHLSATYSHRRFYKASGGSKCDIFLCAENGRRYVPCENELLLYTEPKNEETKGTVYP